MKKLVLSLIAVGMIAGLSNNLQAQTTASATNNARCTIIAPIAITAGQDLMFGDVIKGAGDVTVATNGARTILAAMESGTQLGTIQPAIFTVAGEAAYTYAITLPADDTVSITEGTDPMLLKTFTVLTATDNDADADGTLDASGADTITIGATLQVASDQTPGDYVGTFDVTIAYN
ncbi:MAG: DUF4402 domain-containing protein [Lutibacter sp.]|uniref:DUF4402 domain-containing protein n=1 Tax=Lutibacter sp. TaxID=1925666 RepID=UPI0017CC6855|nr:DUF4402 domain-containing protein [Lutibacter sp.]MBT8317626.1 DUF4402 domain-containing protein [Lutibacter sp.]NNJ58485.1 DUF4402 domain-containing protein [Lutibacter sp.]